MDREKFMQEARVTARDILQGKENGIMNLVHRAWAEGKRNAEVETLRAAIDEALEKRDEKIEQVDLRPKDSILQWIKTTDKLPDVGAPVLFYTTDDMYDVGELTKGYRCVPWVFCGLEVIYPPEKVMYWALITEPPKEGHA